MRLASSPTANVLLVDDSRDGLLVRRALLEEQGFHVHIARNGEEGLKLVDRSAIDVAITEYRLPTISGIEFIGRIRQSSLHTRIVLLSSLVEPLGLTEQSTGADAVVAKNSREASNLIRTVRRLVNRSARPARKPAASQHASRALARVRA